MNNNSTCPINNCGKPTEFYLSFTLEYQNGEQDKPTVCKSMYGALCAEHTVQKQELFEEMGRVVSIIKKK